MAKTVGVQVQEQVQEQVLTQAALAEALLARVGKKEESTTPVTDWLANRLSTPANAAARMAAATTVAFSNIGASYDIERDVQRVRSEKQLKDMAAAAAARILALQ